jgi:hypothetical protein
MLNSLAQILKGYVRPDVWVQAVDQWGKRVDLYRRYMDGDHRADLTPVMKQMLRISGNELDQFNNNYCELVVSTMADRLNIQSIEASGGNAESGQAWADDLLADNRIDALQMEVHESTVCDGDTYILVDYDSDHDQVRFTHEPAWDGETGMIVIYDRRGANIVCAVKVWYEAGFDARRVNIYYPNVIYKYTAGVDGTLTPLMGEDAPLVEEWLPGIVPVAHFKNRARKAQRVGNREHGISELDTVIPLQDALNRTLVSMVMVSELTAFQIRVAKGFTPPQNITPGMWVEIARADPDGKSMPLEQGDVADAYVLEQGNIVPFIQQANDLRQQIGVVSRTPLPSLMGSDSSSGEALKQREVDLLSKVKKAQVVFGNAWEDVMMIAAKVQDAYGSTNAPAVRRWSTKWNDAQIRNNTEIINNALSIREIVGDEEVLRLVAPVFDYGEDKIRDLVNGLVTMEKERISNLAVSLPGFNQGLSNLMRDVV